MNTKPRFHEVVNKIGQTQDGKSLKANDHYGFFLFNLIRSNTNDNLLDIDNRQVDTEELESNLRYAIHEFSKALKAVQDFNSSPVKLK